MRLVLAEETPSRGGLHLVPVDEAPQETPGLRLVPVDETARELPPSLGEVKREQPGGMRLVPVNEPVMEPTNKDELYRAAEAMWKPVPAGADLSDPRNWPKPETNPIDVRDHHPTPLASPAGRREVVYDEPIADEFDPFNPWLETGPELETLPPGVYKENGVYMLERPGKRPVPIREKGLERPMYGPDDLVFDLTTGGTWGFIRTPLEYGLKVALKNLGRHAASDAAWGGVAGGVMEAVNQATGNELEATTAGLSTPLGSKLALTGTRKGIAKGFEMAADNVVKKGWGLTDRIPKMESTELAGHLQSTFGTRAEAIGPDVQGMLLSNEAKTANELKRIAAEMGTRTLNQKLVNAARGKTVGFFMHPDDALILGQRARDFAAKISPRLGARMGLTPDELRAGAKLVEAMPAPDVNGVLRFGVKVKGKDGAMGWAHDLDPVAAQKAFMEQRPQLQKLVLAYISPKGGWRNAPRLADVDYDAGFTAFGDMAARFNLDKAYLENEFKSQGKHKWLGAAEAAGVPREQAELASDYLNRKSAGLVKGFKAANALDQVEVNQVKDISGLPPQDKDRYLEALGKHGWQGLGDSKTGAVYHVVGPEDAAKIKDKTGLDLLGYSHIVDTSGIGHFKSSHGDPLIEAALGQRAVTPDDIRRLPDVVTNFDDVELLPATKRKPARLKYSKLLDGTVYYVEVVGGKRNKLTPKTLYIKKAQKKSPFSGRPAPDGATPGTSETPNTLGSKNSIATPVPGDNLKERLKGRAVKGAGNGLLDMDLEAPEPSLAPDLAALGRDDLHGQLVKAGILEPGQYAEGYLARFGDSSGGPPSLAVDAPDLRLGKVYEPMAQRRGAWFNSDRRLDDTINLQRQVAQESVRHRQLLRKLAPVILEELPQDAKVGADELMRARQVYDPAAGRVVWRQEAMTEVYVPPDEAEALGVKEGRYLIPKALDEHFKVLMGRKKSGEYHTPLQKANDAVKTLATYWTMNVLAAPGTISTNAIGGAAQYSSKWFEDLFRGDLRKLKNTTMAPFMALSPKYRQAVPKEAFGEGANLWRGMDEGGGLFMKDARRRMQEGETVSPVGKALAGADAALHGTLKAHLAPFSGVDDYWKRATFIADARTRAENWADAEIKAGKADPAERGRLVYDRLASTLSERPEEFADIMLGDVDRFAYLYQNTPAWMQKARRNPYFRMLAAPFIVYPYKYGRMVGSQLNAFNPMSKMPMKERVARAGGLVGSAGAPYLATQAYLSATGQESQVEKQRERFKKEHPGKQWPGTRLGGRTFIGKTKDGKERYFRGVKYGPWGLPAMAKGVKDMVTNGSSEELETFLDDFKSRGPGLDLLSSYFEMNPRYGPKDLPSQAAEFAKGFVPFHRWQDYLAKEADKDAQGRMIKRLPKGPGEQILEVIPGQRQKLRQPPDKVTGEPATLNTGQERLKFWTGANFRDVDPAREEAALAAFNLKQGKDWAKKEELAEAFSQRYPQLDREKLMDAMDRILVAGQDAFASIERGTKFKVYKKARENAPGGLDPFDLAKQEALSDLNRKLAGYAVKGMTGMPNLDLARKRIRMTGANNWIVKHWEELKK